MVGLEGSGSVLSLFAPFLSPLIFRLAGNLNRTDCSRLDWMKHSRSFPPFSAPLALLCY